MIYTVTQVNRYMKRLLEDDALLSGLLVEGELSNVSRPASGHVYFTLKDETAAVQGVLFKSYAERLAFLPQNGMRTLVFGRFSLYEKTGQYQLYAEGMEAAGVGGEQTAFERLKDKLAAEGLFDPARKKPLPAYAACVAVVTSPTGAAVRDIINIIRQRGPGARIVLAPAAVQGAEAPRDIARALREVNAWGGADVLIVGRGGGSAEDLAAFNDETVVRAVAASVVPVISAVGHETDFTLTDFAADCRAPTPTAAAALAVYDQAETQAQVRHLAKRLGKTALDAVQARQARVRALCKDFHRAARHSVSKEKEALAHTCARLEKASPYAAWRQGMAWVRGAAGQPVTAAAGLTAGMILKLEWPDGSVRARVQ